MTRLPRKRKTTRLDRVLSLMLFGPLARIRSNEQDRKIPILMYHSIADDSAKSEHPYFSVNTAPSVFAAQMAYLSANGYKAVGMHEALEAVHSERTDLEKLVVLTFDDGYLDVYTSAHSTLSRHGFTATVFLPAAFIHEREGSKFKGKECLSWQKVRELSDCGYRFGSHSMTHRIFKSLHKDEIEKEVRESKDTIEQNIGIPVESFSHPYAFPEENQTYRTYLRRILEESGYTNGVSTAIGRISRNKDKYFLNRIPVNTYDDPALFRVKMEGGYDWLHSVQYGYKHVRSIFR